MINKTTYGVKEFNRKLNEIEELEREGHEAYRKGFQKDFSHIMDEINFKNSSLKDYMEMVAIDQKTWVNDTETFYPFFYLIMFYKDKVIDRDEFLVKWEELQKNSNFGKNIKKEKTNTIRKCDEIYPPFLIPRETTSIWDKTLAAASSFFSSKHYTDDELEKMLDEFEKQNTNKKKISKPKRKSRPKKQKILSQEELDKLLSEI